MTLRRQIGHDASMEEVLGRDDVIRLARKVKILTQQMAALTVKFACRLRAEDLEPENPFSDDVVCQRDD